MPRQTDTPEDLSAFLSRPEDLARALDARAAEERTRETLRKAAENANFAAAMKALDEGPKEEAAKPVVASERAEYNPAKTIPPRTRRDTLELQPKLIVPAEMLDSRHRPTAKIERPPVVEREAAPPPAAALETPAAEPPHIAAPEELPEPPPSSSNHSTLEGLGQLGAQEIAARAAARSAASAQPEASAPPAPTPTPIPTPRDSVPEQAPPKEQRSPVGKIAVVAALLLVALGVARCLARGEGDAPTNATATTSTAAPPAASPALSIGPTADIAAPPEPTRAEAPSPPDTSGTTEPPREPSRPTASQTPRVSTPVPPRPSASPAITTAPPTAAPEKTSGRLGLPYDEKKNDEKK